MNEELGNYFQLVARVDSLCRGIEETLTGQINCRQGCSSCCKTITVFPVEAAALFHAIEALPAEEAAAIRHYVAGHAAGEACVLLAEQRCLIYSARPVICRTHGLPILFSENGQARVDYCPQNLQDCKSLPGSAVIDLDRLNELLVTVNSLFLSRTGLPAAPARRVTIADAVLGKLDQGIAVSL